MLIGIISDTHGLMRPEALAALEGSDLIVHAGDVGSMEIIDHLVKIAPTYAVRGNIDLGSNMSVLPETAVIGVGEKKLYMLHDISQLAVDPLQAGIAAVVFGHSHQPLIELRGDVLFMNPGSAGPRRFRLSITVGRIRASGTRWHPEIVTIAA